MDMSRNYDSNDWLTTVNRHLRETKMNISMINNRHEDSYALREPSSPIKSSVRAHPLGHIPTQNDIHNRLSQMRRQEPTSIHLNTTTTDSMYGFNTRLSLLEQKLGGSMRDVYRDRNEFPALPPPETPPPAAITWPSNNYESRYSMLEQSINVINLQLSKLTTDLGESRKHCDLLQQITSKQQDEIANLHAELDLRRAVSIKSENALRQSELWRTEFETEMAALRQQLRFVERQGKDHEEFMKSTLTRSDLEAGVYLDRLASGIQRNVLTALAGWRAQVDSRLQQTASSGEEGAGTGAGVVDDREALPSDKLVAFVEVKTQEAVDACLHKLSTDLEERVYNKVMFDVRNDIREVKTECQAAIARLAAAAGITEGAEELFIGDRLVPRNAISLSAVKILDSTVQTLSLKVDAVETSLQAIKVQTELQDRSLAAQMQSLQGRVDDCFAANEAMVNVAKERAGGLENLVRTADLQHKDQLTKTSNEMIAMLNHYSDGWNEEHSASKKKMLLLEKLVESMVDKLGAVRRDIQATISATPEYKRMLQLTPVLDRMNVDIAELQHNHIAMSNVHDDMTVFANDTQASLAELRGQYREVEPLNRQLSVLGKSQETMQNSVTVLLESKVALEKEQSRCVRQEVLDAHLSELQHHAEASSAAKKSLEADVKALNKSLIKLSEESHVNAVAASADRVSVEEKLRSLQLSTSALGSELSVKLSALESADRQTRHELDIMTGKVEGSLTLQYDVRTLARKLSELAEEMEALRSMRSPYKSPEFANTGEGAARFPMSPMSSPRHKAFSFSGDDDRERMVEQLADVKAKNAALIRDLTAEARPSVISPQGQAMESAVMPIAEEKVDEEDSQHLHVHESKDDDEKEGDRDGVDAEGDDGDEGASVVEDSFDREDDSAAEEEKDTDTDGGGDEEEKSVEHSFDREDAAEEKVEDTAASRDHNSHPRLHAHVDEGKHDESAPPSPVAATARDAVHDFSSDDELIPAEEAVPPPPPVEANEDSFDVEGENDDEVMEFSEEKAADEAPAHPSSIDHCASDHLEAVSSPISRAAYDDDSFDQSSDLGEIIHAAHSPALPVVHADETKILHPVPRTTAAALDALSSDDEMIPAEDPLIAPAHAPYSSIQRSSVMRTATNESDLQTPEFSDDEMIPAEDISHIDMTARSHSPSPPLHAAQPPTVSTHHTTSIPEPTQMGPTSPLAPIETSHAAAQLPPLDTSKLSIRERLLLRTEMNKKEKLTSSDTQHSPLKPLSVDSGVSLSPVPSHGKLSPLGKSSPTANKKS